MEQFNNLRAWFTKKIFGGPKFQIYINEGEYLQIKEWVLKKPDIETGGDLFGLWIDRTQCVVQFVTGPGKGCRRSNVCFYQDTSYLKRCGDYLLKNHGLCNTGQWHSHHRLHLKEPSRGDEKTVWRNMPELHLNAFIVCIATIEDDENGKPFVDLNCFLFQIDPSTGEKQLVEGEFKMLKGNSPLRLNKSTYNEIMKGAESVNRYQLLGRDELACLEKQKVEITVVNEKSLQRIVPPSVESSERGAKWYVRTPESDVKQKELVNVESQQCFDVTGGDQIIRTSRNENPVTEKNDVAVIREKSEEPLVAIEHDGNQKIATSFNENSSNENSVSKKNDVAGVSDESEEPFVLIESDSNQKTATTWNKNSDSKTNDVVDGKPEHVYDFASGSNPKPGSSQNDGKNSMKNDQVAERKNQDRLGITDRVPKPVNSPNENVVSDVANTPLDTKKDLTRKNMFTSSIILTVKDYNIRKVNGSVGEESRKKTVENVQITKKSTVIYHGAVSSPKKNGIVEKSRQKVENDPLTHQENSSEKNQTNIVAKRVP